MYWPFADLWKCKVKIFHVYFGYFEHHYNSNNLIIPLRPRIIRILLYCILDAMIPPFNLELCSFLPNDKNLERTKLKAFADNKLNTAKMMTAFYDREENMVGKGENVVYQHFLLFFHCFLRVCLPGSLKVYFSAKFSLQNRIKLCQRMLTKKNLSVLRCIYPEESWFNPLPDNKFETLPNWKGLQTTISNLTKMEESYPNR